MDQVKRCFDVVTSLLAFTLLSPLFLLIAAWIRLDSPGSIFFAQRRVGKNGKEFLLYKFRTMFDRNHRPAPVVSPPRSEAEAKFRRDFCCESCAQPLEKCVCVTHSGRFLRRVGLDELPQLWNILRGDMTFVGPRPTLRYQVEQYSPWERRRLAVRPGLTGLAQVSGRNEIPWETKIELDLWYIEHRSLWLDCKILFKTFLHG